MRRQWNIGLGDAQFVPYLFYSLILRYLPRHIQMVVFISQRVDVVLGNRFTVSLPHHVFSSLTADFLGPVFVRILPNCSQVDNVVAFV